LIAYGNIIVSHKGNKSVTAEIRNSLKHRFVSDFDVVDPVTVLLHITKMEPPRQGHLIARIRMKDGVLDLKHTLAVELAGAAPSDVGVVRNVSATIYLAYVRNANGR
jgi:hypothetical protein